MADCSREDVTTREKGERREVVGGGRGKMVIDIGEKGTKIVLQATCKFTCKKTCICANSIIHLYIYPMYIYIGEDYYVDY